MPRSPRRPGWSAWCSGRSWWRSLSGSAGSRSCSSPWPVRPRSCTSRCGTVPGVESTAWTAFTATWVSAMVGTLISWATTAGTDDGLITSLTRRARRQVTVDDPDVDGVLFVQLDGVPFPVMRWAVQSGAVPNIRRWLASGDYRAASVDAADAVHDAGQPARHPARHASTGVPAFRWYDRELGRVLVANRPADARVIEERASTGRGLLAEDGVSISNLFTGDAPRSLMTMSRVEVAAGDHGDEAGVRLVPHFPERVHAQLQPHCSPRSSRSAGRHVARSSATSTLASIAAGPSRSCGRSQTRCCGTSTRPWWRRRCAAAPEGHLRRLRRLRRDRAPRRHVPARVVGRPGRPRPNARVACAARPRPHRGGTAWSRSPTTASPRAPPLRTGTALRSATSVRR